MVRECETMSAPKARARRARELPEIAAVLRRTGVVSVSVAGASAVLTPAVASALREIVAHALRGEVVAVVARRAELTTQQAADLLGLSRQHVVRLVDSGRLGVRMTKAGAHRRLAAVDVLRLKAEREGAAAHARAVADLFEAEVARIREERTR